MRLNTLKDYITTVVRTTAWLIINGVARVVDVTEVGYHLNSFVNDHGYHMDAGKVLVGRHCFSHFAVVTLFRVWTLEPHRRTTLRSATPSRTTHRSREAIKFVKCPAKKPGDLQSLKDTHIPSKAASWGCWRVFLRVGFDGLRFASPILR